MLDRVNALFFLAALGYGLYLAWGLLILLVTAPRGSLLEALATAEVDEDEEDHQRRRRRCDEDEHWNQGYCWNDDD